MVRLPYPLVNDHLLNPIPSCADKMASVARKEGAPLNWRPSAVADAGNGPPLMRRPSADAVAGNGAPLSWRPSADAVAGEEHAHGC